VEDTIVKVKKSDLEKLIDANTKVYNILDDITISSTEVGEKVKEAFSILEDAPSEISDIIVEEEVEEKE